MSEVDLWVLVVVPLLSAILGFIGGVLGAQINARTQDRLSERRFRQELSMAALEKRLQVLQEGFSYWRRVVKSLYSPEILNPLISKASQWWDDNCLYMPTDVADPLRRSFDTAATFEGMRHAADAHIIKLEMDDILAPGNLIRAAVGLPQIGRPELEKELKEK